MINVNNEGRNISVSLARVSGMFLILLCHLSTWLGYDVLTQLFNVGVQLFLFVSGFLYGKKEIPNYWVWIKKRFLRIYIPLYAFLIFIVSYNFLIGIKPDTIQILGYIFNLQGLGSFIGLFSFNSILGMGHLWFLTAIMLCYLYTILLKQYEKKYFISAKTAIIILSIFLIAQCTLDFFKIHLNCIFIYTIGYCFSKYSIKLSKLSYYFLTLFMIFGIIIRLLARHYVDGSILYDHVIVALTHDILAVWIFQTFCYTTGCNKKFASRLAGSKLILSFDKLSFYIYITHYMFLVGPFNLNSISRSVYISFIFFLILTFISSIMLYKFCSLITSNT